MIEYMETQVVDFADAIGIESQVLITYINKWAREDDCHKIILSNLKIQYVNECVIGKQTLKEFEESISQTDRIATMLLNIYREETGNHDALDLDPFTQTMIQKENEPFKQLYLDIVKCMKKSKVDTGMKLLDRVLRDYANLQY